MDILSRKIKETRQHLDSFTKEKLTFLERHSQQTSKMEVVLQGSLQAASAISTRISQMDKSLKDISKYVTEVNAEIKSDLQALDKSI